LLATAATSVLSSPPENATTIPSFPFSSNHAINFLSMLLWFMSQLPLYFSVCYDLELPASHTSDNASGNAEKFSVWYDHSLNFFRNSFQCFPLKFTLLVSINMNPSPISQQRDGEWEVFIGELGKRH